MLMKAAWPLKRKERLMTCTTNVKYWSGRTGMVAQMENNKHCNAVKNRGSAEACRSASCSLCPTNRHQQRNVYLFFQIDSTKATKTEWEDHKKYSASPAARGLRLCLSMRRPFQGAQNRPHSWVMAKALMYWLTVVTHKQMGIRDEKRH